MCWTVGVPRELECVARYRSNSRPSAARYGRSISAGQLAKPDMPRRSQLYRRRFHGLPQFSSHLQGRHTLLPEAPCSTSRALDAFKV